MQEGDTRHVFDIDQEQLLKFSRLCVSKQSNAKRDLLQTSNTSVLLKFCDVCKAMNVDPLHPYSLHVVIIYMSKSKHCGDIAKKFTDIQGCPEVIVNMCVEEDELLLRGSYESMLNSMADWITLFSYLEMQLHVKNDFRIQSVINELERNRVVNRMITSLTDANVRSAGKLPGQQIDSLETAVMALLYLSPRSTPAGKMLERLYTDINENPREAELRCLRAMTSFKDTMDDEEAYTEAFQLVLRSFEAKEDFLRSIAAVLRKRMANAEESLLDSQTKHPTRPLLRSYVQQALASKQKSISQDSWIKWQLGVNFQNATSSHLQRLLYFIEVQSVKPERSIYECYYTSDICNRSSKIKVDVIDSEAIIMVIGSLRLYLSNIKKLIDFSASCLRGVNQKQRQSLSLVQILQLYISVYQHESIWKECWKKFLDFMNHTIIADVKRFKEQHPYDVDAVIVNLVHSLVEGA
jgi:hypothetical protein